MSKNKGLSRERRQQLSDRVLVLTLMVQLLLLVNQSLGLYTTAAQTMKASMVEPTGETIQIQIKTDTGRLSPIERLLKNTRNWYLSYSVGGVEVTKATTGITIIITGTNVVSTAEVEYYIEGIPQNSGTPFRFLEASVTTTVNGETLQITNETSIEKHLEAMGLNTTESCIIDYYVYVKASTIGVISGQTLTSEIAYQQFDTVIYKSQTLISENIPATGSHYTIGSIDGFYSYNIYVGELSNTYYDYEGCSLFTGSNIPNRANIEEAYLTFRSYGVGEAIGAMRIIGEDVDSATEVTNYSDFISRTHTEAYLDYTPDSWVKYNYIDSPDISNIITEITSREGYTQGNDIQIFYLDILPEYNGVFDRLGSFGDGVLTLHISYLGYEASWYPLSTMSLVSIPITLDTVALTILIVVTVLTINRRKTA